MMNRMKKSQVVVIKKATEKKERREKERERERERERGQPIEADEVFFTMTKKRYQRNMF